MKTILSIYGIMSLVTLIVYAVDKSAAGTARPESAPYQDLRLSASPREHSAVAGEVVSRGGAATRSNVPRTLASTLCVAVN